APPTASILDSVAIHGDRPSATMPGRCQSSRTALSGDATRPCLHPWRRIAGLAPPVAMRFDSVATHGVLLRAISPNERHRRARPNPARAPETSPAPPGAAGRGGRSGASVNSEQPRMLVRHVTLHAPALRCFAC